MHLAPPYPVGNKGERGRDQPLRTLAHPGGLGDAATETGDLLADRAVAVGEMQVARGRYVSIENPWESWMWELKSLKKLKKRTGMFFIQVDPCAYGGPHYCPLGVLTNCPWLVRAARSCSKAGPHEHTPLTGQTKAGEHPFDMCDMWAEAFEGWLLEQGAPDPQGYIQGGAYTNELLRAELGPKGKKQRGGQTSTGARKRRVCGRDAESSPRRLTKQRISDVGSRGEGRFG